MVAKLVLYQSDGQVLMDNSALPFFQWKFVHAASHHREDQTMSSREKSPMIKRSCFEPEKSSFRKARHFFLGTGSKNCLELETEDSSSSAEILIRVHRKLELFWLIPLVRRKESLQCVFLCVLQISTHTIYPRRVSNVRLNYFVK